MGPMFVDLTDAEMVDLRGLAQQAFKGATVAKGRMPYRSNPVKLAAAFLNEVDSQLTRRGILDPTTGQISPPFQMMEK